jgi:hypothetical protein
MRTHKIRMSNTPLDMGDMGEKSKKIRATFITYFVILIAVFIIGWWFYTSYKTKPTSNKIRSAPIAPGKKSKMKIHVPKVKSFFDAGLPTMYGSPGGTVHTKVPINKTKVFTVPVTPTVATAGPIAT